MKSNVIKVVLAALIILAPMMGQAQNRGNMGDMQKRRQEQRDALKKDLKLSKKQATDFDAVYEKYDKKMAEMRQAGGGGDREAMREKMTTMREDLDKELKKVLDEKQFKKMKEIEQKQREQRAQGRGGQGGRGGMGGGRG